MTDYTYAQTVNTDALNDAVSESSVGANLAGIVGEQGSTTITMEPALDASQEAILDAILAEHNPAVPSVTQRVNAAKQFAGELDDRWQKRIMLDGVVQAGQAYTVATALAACTIHASFGNLYALDDELGTITPIATFLDADRIVLIRNEIREYLGMTLL